VARYSTQGLDFSAAVNYARDVGGPALSALTFPQRAGCLKQLGKLLMAGKDEFYPLSFATGATARTDYGEVRWDAVVTNQDDVPVATYDVLTLVAKLH